jgi:Niemann-Pick C1 protein
MFIISSAVKRCKENSLEDRIRHGLSDVGPSITAAAFSEIFAFVVGSFTKMPALQTFCTQAAIAVLFNYIF